MNSPASRILRVEGLSCRLGGNQILQGLTLPALRGGGLAALLGPNGSGKSTLLRSIAGLAPARFDTLSLDKLDMRGLSARARADTIRYLPQFLPESIHLTVTEALLVALNARGGLAPAAAMSRTEAVLDTLGIGHLGPRYLDELSGGQKQLVGLAQALADEPAVLLLDEPLASLDLNFQHHAMRLLKRLAADHGLLVLIVLHDLNIALRYADTAVLLRQGRLLAAGEPLSVITPSSIAQAFQVRARVESCSLGHANVLVDDLIQL
ncbi:ABC transporter ATP-binding protein [Pollutimonas sp. M17]|uniref:ABC transporter ATP-binding protein n=1 Tax=Pollutimonas sp. M17 TaxID=2962065 RepID=UPI0021F3EA7F|nr:ABC transporter ATP-binding protein [Pollutimonas sp. M17]UYO94456.1 ABC transporter ATP-binding protein [Pollutimonas sp. M17]